MAVAAGEELGIKTSLSDVDGEGGRLIVRGKSIEALAGHVSFEETAALLWDELSPQPESTAAIRTSLGVARVFAYNSLLPVLRDLKHLAPLEALRAGLAALPNEPAGIAPHHLVTAAIPVIMGAHWRLSRDLGPVKPSAGASHAADFLRMRDDKTPSPAEVKALETYMVCVAEHGMNASTFTARVVASTLAGIVPSVVAAYCALTGPLHGGAPGPVLDMLDAIGTPDKIWSWLDQELASGSRLMGFGHRIYRVRDPRADVLKEAVRGLAHTERLAFAAEVEKEALAALARHKPDRPLDTNVEFYTAILLNGLGFDRSAFTAVFASGRVLGWTAHAFEQVKTGRLIRPPSQYVGPAVSA